MITLKYKIRSVLKEAPPPVLEFARRFYNLAQSLTFTAIHKAGYTKYRMAKNSKKKLRMLEIGPGANRIPEFETLNVVGDGSVDYVLDARKRLPFPDGTFDLIYASHVLEHVAWYQTDSVLKEWNRILKPGGRIEIWVPNGLLICKTLVEFEETGKNNIHQDGWYKFNENRDSCVWAAGRIFSYGDGTGRKDDPNWHFAIFSPRYLLDALSRAGFCSVEELSREQVRGHDHGWINLGATGIKR